MATEVGETTYCPLIIGTWRWDEEIGSFGGWSFELEHDLLLTGPYHAATALVLPKGHLLKWECGETKGTVITGMYWQPVPGPEVVDEIAAGTNELENVRQQAQMLRDQLLEVLPF